jgi:hypothetical protein
MTHILLAIFDGNDPTLKVLIFLASSKIVSRFRSISSHRPQLNEINNYPKCIAYGENVTAFTNKFQRLVMLSPFHVQDHMYLRTFVYLNQNLLF